MYRYFAQAHALRAPHTDIGITRWCILEKIKYCIPYFSRSSSRLCVIHFVVLRVSWSKCLNLTAKMKWNKWGCRPPLCTCRLNWASRTSWGWCDECDGTVLQTQDSKFEPRRSEVEHATSRSRRLPTILNLYEWAGKKHFLSLKRKCQSGVQTRDLRFSKQAALTALTAALKCSKREWRKWRIS